MMINTCWNQARSLISITLVVILTTLPLVSSAEDTRTWLPLSEDNLHDPDLEALQLLQNPADALRDLPSDYVGNQVAWVQALAEGDIAPRANLYPGTRTRVVDQNIIMGNTGEMPLVMFPHREHTEWLDCSNCHEEIFKSKVDANNFSMFDILAGEKCGICHGGVSFPLTECNRCHSVLRETFEGQLGAQSTVEAVNE
jgi:c(7)-type cytochrome triheme protein